MHDVEVLPVDIPLEFLVQLGDPAVRAVKGYFDGIKSTDGIGEIPRFFSRLGDDGKHVVFPGQIDEVIVHAVYDAVDVGKIRVHSHQDFQPILHRLSFSVIQSRYCYFSTIEKNDKCF